MRRGRRIEKLEWWAGEEREREREKGNWWSVKNWRGRRRKIGGDQVEIGQWEERQTNV